MHPSPMDFLPPHTIAVETNFVSLDETVIKLLLLMYTAKHV